MFTINQNLIDDFADKINEKEKKNNKVTSLSSSSTHVQYPSAKAVYDAISEVEASSGGNYIYDFYHDSSTDDIVLEYDSASGGGSGGSGGSCVTDFYIDSQTDEWVITTSACSQGEVVSSWEQTLSDEKVPSEKLVKDSLDDKQDELVSGTNLKTLNGVDLLGEGDIVIDVSCGGSTTLFEDTCSTDNTSQYTNFYEIWASQSTIRTSLTFDTDHYVLSNSNESFSTVCLPVTAGLDEWKLTAKIRLLTNSSNKGGGVGVATQKEKGIAIFQPNDTTSHLLLNNYAGAITSNVSVSNLSTTDYNTFELVKDGTGLSFKVYNSSNTEVFSKDVTISDSTYYPNCVPCISVGQSDSVYVKDIKLESLGGGSTIIFEDTGSASGVSNYSTAHILETGGTTTFTLTWDTTQNAYHVQTNPSKASMIAIDALDGYTGDFKLSADIMRTSTSYFGGLCYCQKEKYGFIYGLGSSKFMGHHYANGSWLGELNPTGSSSLNTWYHMELVKESDTITISVYDSTGVTLLASTSKTYTDDDNYFGFAMSNYYFKNVKAVTIGSGSSISLSENTIYLGDDIMTMIDTALGHMITNWGDYD